MAIEILPQEGSSNPFEETGRAGGIPMYTAQRSFPLTPQDWGIDPEASRWNYNKAQINMNEPDARKHLRESYRMDQEQGIQNWYADAIPGSEFGAGPDVWGITSYNRGQPIYNAGITNPNLGGAQVWNAGGPFEGDYPLPGMQWLEHKLFGDPDDTQPPPVGEGGGLLPGWELQQDGWHYFPPFEGDDQDLMDQFMEDVEPEDLGVSETMEAQSQWKRPENMEKTIKSLELRPEFEGWTHDEIKYWIINQARANRGGIIGLL